MTTASPPQPHGLGGVGLQPLWSRLAAAAQQAVPRFGSRRTGHDQPSGPCRDPGHTNQRQQTPVTPPRGDPDATQCHHRFGGVRVHPPGIQRPEAMTTLRRGNDQPTRVGPVPSHQAMEHARQHRTRHPSRVGPRAVWIESHPLRMANGAIPQPKRVALHGNLARRRTHSNRLNTNDPFVPPNPKLFFRAYRMGISRAVLAQ